jgi:hypothetical protein
MPEYYSYILVRTDLSPEQQLVQAAHAAIKLGASLESKIDPDLLNLVVCGVANEDALWDAHFYIEDNDYYVKEFVESDLGYEATAIATEPIKAKKRAFMKQFKLLKIKR